MGPFNRVAAGAWLRSGISCCQNLVSLYLSFRSSFFHLRLTFPSFLKQVTVAMLIKPGVTASCMTSALKQWGEEGKVLLNDHILLITFQGKDRLS